MLLISLAKEAVHAATEVLVDIAEHLIAARDQALRGRGMRGRRVQRAVTLALPVDILLAVDVVPAVSLGVSLALIFWTSKQVWLTAL